ncbi:MAG: hypothetical protein V3U24_07050 [Candidatus Neomarinimicrobiota bacterium]
MKIGFDTGGDDAKKESESGFADGSEKDDELFDWMAGLIMDFFLVYGTLALVRDVLNYFRGR